MDGIQKMQEHFSAGREHPVEASEVDSWLGNKGSQSRDKIQRLEDHMGGTVSERGFEFITQLAGGRKGEALFCNGGPCYVSAQSFQLLALMSPSGHASIQAETV